MELKEVYDENFWRQGSLFNYTSAKNVLSLFFQWHKPKSIIDIGCGVGSWLKAAKELGIDDIFGVDINEIDEKYLLVPRKYIEIANLETYKQNNHNRYDLAISIEVAEHLSENVAEDFINTLTNLSNVILFSAAIPLQVGTNHINCQQPIYWYNIFKSNGYVCFDILRDLLRDFEDSEVNPCHKQNVLIYVKKDNKEIFENFGFQSTDKPDFFYHPAYFNNALNTYKEEIKSKISNKDLKINWLPTVFGISNNKNTLRITILFIKITIKMTEEKINKLAWWIPIRKWRDDFRGKFN